MKDDELQYQPLTPNMDRDDPRFAHEDCQNLFDVYATYYQKNGFNPPWHAYLFYVKNRAVGVCGFTGSPTNGRIEIAYYIFKAYEGRGIGSSACAAIIELFHQQKTDFTLYARTAPEPGASSSILKRNGFEFSDMVQDIEIGDAWEWVYASSAKGLFSSSV